MQQELQLQHCCFSNQYCNIFLYGIIAIQKDRGVADDVAFEAPGPKQLQLAWRGGRAGSRIDHDKGHAKNAPKDEIGNNADHHEIAGWW